MPYCYTSCFCYNFPAPAPVRNLYHVTWDALCKEMSQFLLLYPESTEEYSESRAALVSNSSSHASFREFLTTVTPEFFGSKWEGKQIEV